ncbi:MAG: shikimate dehydrogenase [Frankiaceae bacterium]|jgi:shikimate dehydrogenase|nr:shikimate dehydrogenase [Frankiaceae bacterium]
MTEFPRRGAVVLGSPIAHSLSPVLHRAAYQALGLSDWRYDAVECGEAELASTLQRLDAEGLAGASLTMPLKRSVLAMLARTDRLAADVGAANTVLFGAEPGVWWGANTDVPGMVAALRGVGGLDPRSVAVLGGGATATSALAALRELGISGATVYARRPEAADELRAGAARMGLHVDVVPFAQAAASAEADLTIATTPAGATDELAAALPVRVAGVLFDVVYDPWPTALAAAWSSRSGTVVGGLELLVAQAAEQVRLMTGLQPPIAEMRAAGLVASRG